MLLWFHYYSNHMDIMDKHVNSSDNTLTVKHGWDCGSNPVPDEHYKHRPRSISYGLTRTQCTSVDRRSRIKCSDSMQQQVWVHPHSGFSWQDEQKWRRDACCFIFDARRTGLHKLATMAEMNLKDWSNPDLASTFYQLFAATFDSNVLPALPGFDSLLDLIIFWSSMNWWHTWVQQVIVLSWLK